MKKITLFSSALMGSVLFASSVAMAAPQEQHHRLDINVSKLDMRIEAGVKDGKLTPMEERELRTELRQLNSAMKFAMADHRVTKGERFSLKGKEAALSQHITKLANNRVVVKQANEHEEHGTHRVDQGRFDQDSRDYGDYKTPPKPDYAQQGRFNQDNRDQGDKGNYKAPPKPDNAQNQHQRMPHAQQR